MCQVLFSVHYIHYTSEADAIISLPDEETGQEKQPDHYEKEAPKIPNSEAMGN